MPCCHFGLTGVGYKRHHEMQFPLKGDLQAAVDAYMISFTASEASRSRLLARQRAIPDEDGFITVTRGGRVGPARNEEAQEKQEELQKKEEEKRAGMGDFYRFQVREQKKQRAGDLVKRFQHDRRRVDDMRKQKGNRFKPRDRATTG
jgi:ribosomal RNA-processing protein 7